MSVDNSKTHIEIFLVRHTKVALSSEFCYGNSDVELAETYLQDIALVRKKLNGINFQKSYSSPLNRCKLLSESLTKDVVIEKSLMEMSLGDWELQKWSDLDQEKLNEWMEDFVNISPPNSECYLEFSMKPVSFFDKMVKSMKNGDQILLVSHSGPIRAIICHALNLSLSHAFNFEIDFGSVSKIEVKNGWYKLKFLNY